MPRHYKNAYGASLLESTSSYARCALQEATLWAYEVTVIPWTCIMKLYFWNVVDVYCLELVMSLVVNLNNPTWLLRFLKTACHLLTYNLYSLLYRHGVSVFIEKVYGKVHHQCDVILFGSPLTPRECYFYRFPEELYVFSRSHIIHSFDHKVGST